MVCSRKTGRWWALLVMMPMVVFGCNLQDRLLYYPEHHVPSEADLARRGMRFWPTGPDGYRGFSGGPAKGSRGTVVVFHGNAATAADRWYYIEPLARLGFRVILAEYPGYGKRGGKPGEASFVRDGRETLSLAARDGRPLILLGESLGAAVAAAVLQGGGVAVAGVVLVTPWATLEQVAKEKFPFLPVRMLLTDRFDTIGNLRGFPGRVAVMAAARDDIIPPHHARTLFDSFHGEKRFWAVPGAGHNDWPDLMTDVTWKEVMDFAVGQTKVR